MRNEASVAAVDSARWGDHFRRPLYGSYCFSGLPRTVRWLLTGSGQPDLPPDVLGPYAGRHDAVVLFFLDAFGWRLATEATSQLPFFRRCAEQGVLSKLTSQFPSTTACHVTAIHTGLTGGESGVYEWNYFEPRLGTIITPLPFAFYGQPRGSLRHSGVTGRDLFPTRTLYHELAEHGVRSHILGGQEVVDSPYSEVVQDGAEVTPHKSFAELLVNLDLLLQRRRGPSYFMVYYDRIDAHSHLYGPGSPQTAAEVEAVGTLLELWLQRQRASAWGDVLFMITADHGQVDVDPQRTVFVNRELPDVIPCLQTDRLGRPLTPAGSRRDLFLHVKEPHREQVRDRLRGHLLGRAEVHPVADLITQGFFGSGPPSQKFLDRVGNLVVLPYARESVWWASERHGDREKVLGSHGGLTPEEMEIPLIVWSPS